MGMNPEAKELWLTALRSGKYQQGTGALNKNGKFCCLGVLCDISVEMLQLEVSAGASRPCSCGAEHDVKTSYDGETAHLPAEVTEWSGVDTIGSIPYKYGSYTYANLAEMNDEGKTFEEIAQIIEERF